MHAHLIKSRLLHRPAVAEPLLESAALLLPVPTIDCALSIFSNLENPDPSAYAIMIRGFTKLQSPENRFQTYDRTLCSAGRVHILQRSDQHVRSSRL
ncbi:hypothetical protein PHJA_001761100 [Phtheirospermum japonicum]|uniref:Uncharacterized protein n=1 Tax=Phtheirospermum japonicum TaxID=374723 RepID=A0A830C9B4_9LAMI|nr:hypothetical protein PHJA_001761100 [Phtheirospermum japonicum]